MASIPNLLTFSRMAAIPLLVVFFYLPWSWAADVCAGLFVLAAITDWLDGWLARLLKQTSSLGAFLDPVADKLLVAVALVLLVVKFPYLALPAVVIVCREIAVSALREWMAILGMREKMAVTTVAKVKTALQFVAISVLLAYRPGQGVWFWALGCGLLVLAACLTLWSMMVYISAAWPTWRGPGPR